MTIVFIFIFEGGGGEGKISSQLNFCILQLDLFLNHGLCHDKHTLYTISLKQHTTLLFIIHFITTFEVNTKIKSCLLVVTLDFNIQQLTIAELGSCSLEPQISCTYSLC